jgi:hypothetical protein
MHKANDNPLNNKKIVDGLSDPIIVNLGFLILKQMLENDMRANVTIDFNRSKIIGNYTYAMFKVAVKRYLMIKQKVLKDEMRMFRITEDQAIEKITLSLAKDYLPTKTKK